MARKLKHLWFYMFYQKNKGVKVFEKIDKLIYYIIDSGFFICLIIPAFVLIILFLN